MDKLLKLLEDNATLTPAELAVMLNKEEGDIRALIEKYEQDGVIVGYKTLVDWDKTDREYVTAMIEVKMTPQRDRGFDRFAECYFGRSVAEAPDIDGKIFFTSEKPCKEGEFVTVRFTDILDFDMMGEVVQ